MCLLFEGMEAVTSSLMQTSAIAYAAELGTTQTLATIQGIVQATYFGMGEFSETTLSFIRYFRPLYVLHNANPTYFRYILSYGGDRLANTVKLLI